MSESLHRCLPEMPLRSDDQGAGAADPEEGREQENIRGGNMPEMRFPLQDRNRPRIIKILPEMRPALEMKGITMKSQKEIIEALKTIKEVCKESSDCYECPLRKNRTLCYINEKVPINWDIHDSAEMWSAFNETKGVN